MSYHQITQAERYQIFALKPEQISGRRKYEGLGSVSHETIYRYLEKDKQALVTVVDRKSKFALI